MANFRLISGFPTLARRETSSWKNASAISSPNGGRKFHPKPATPSRQTSSHRCQALLTAAPKAVSSIMDLYPPAFVAERQMVGLIALIPQVADAVTLPVIATGGIADARGVAAALILGASAVQIGTGFLRSPEAKTHPAYSERLARTEAHDTMITRAFSGRPGRSAANAYVRAANSPTAPSPAPYPVQRGLTRAMREAANKCNNVDSMQLWSGQSARLAQSQPAANITQQLWEAASQLLT